MLDSDWISSAPIDFEYKQYKLLAYEQLLKEKIKSKKLYPVFLSLLENLKYANDFIKKIDDIKNAIKSPIGLDLKNQKVIYDYPMTDESVEEYLKIATFGYDIMNTIYDEFKILYDQVDESIEIKGDRNHHLFDHISGFLVITHNFKATHYQYRVHQQYHPVPTENLEIEVLPSKIFYEKVYTKNVFDVILNGDYPLHETMLPVMKSKFLRFIIS